MATRLTAHERELRSITEDAWQQHVIRIARAYGWRHYHPPRAGLRSIGSVRDTVPGYPDLTLVRGPRLIFAELKSQIGPVRAEQQAWLDALAAASVETYLWRPGDLADVTATLSRRAG